jgi:hypothetical protein
MGLDANPERAAFRVLDKRSFTEHDFERRACVEAGSAHIRLWAVFAELDCKCMIAKEFTLIFVRIECVISQNYARSRSLNTTRPNASVHIESSTF